MKAFCEMCKIRLKALFDNLRNLGNSPKDIFFQLAMLDPNLAAAYIRRNSVQ